MLSFRMCSTQKTINTKPVFITTNLPSLTVFDTYNQNISITSSA